jgi:hypothetical protein
VLVDGDVPAAKPAMPWFVDASAGAVISSPRTPIAAMASANGASRLLFIRPPH